MRIQRYNNLDGEEIKDISQSGETADSLATLRESKEKGVRTMAIVNVVGSSIAREADSVFYTLAGPEIAVATTKAYSTQLMATYVRALQFAKVRSEISDETYNNMIAELLTIPDKIDPHFATSLAVIPLQLLGYYISVAKGLDVDKPRNLAKSVTVE